MSAPVRRFGRHDMKPRDIGRSPLLVAYESWRADKGHQWRFKFANGFGASVIDDGYGGEAGLYELAVLGPDGHLDYSTPITDDVLGHLTAEEVAATLDRIEALA